MQSFLCSGGFSFAFFRFEWGFSLTIWACDVWSLRFGSPCVVAFVACDSLQFIVCHVVDVTLICGSVVVAS
jgi:hypothetical protein